jgi:hypothetical protein
MPMAYYEYGAVWTIDLKFWKCLSGTWPFGLIIISHKKIVIRILWKKFEISKESINGIKKVYWGAPGIKVLHTCQAYPKHIYYWPVNFPRLARRLKEYGYALMNEAKENGTELN